MSATAQKSNQTATYKGRKYRCLFCGPTKFGRRAHLQFFDGSKDFWVSADLVELSAAASESVPGASQYGSYATIGQRTRERMRRTGWTGCSCGSIEGQPRDSDCWTCRHDSE